MNRQQAADLRPGDVVISPDSSPPWKPMRVTEVFTSPRPGLTRLRFSAYRPNEWLPPDNFILAPAGSRYDARVGRWLRDGVDVTPKRSDIETDAVSEEATTDA